MTNGGYFLFLESPTSRALDSNHGNRSTTRIVYCLKRITGVIWGRRQRVTGWIMAR